MILPTFFKRRTSRRTSKRRQNLSKTNSDYSSLENRNLLATFVVNTTADVVDAEDGLLSLREAVTAANANETFSDAPAGDVDGDRIIFASGEEEFSPYVLSQGELTITDDLIVRGEGIEEAAIQGGGASQIFNVLTSERVQFRSVILVGGSAEGPGGVLSISPSSEVVIRDSQLSLGNATAGGAINVVDSRLYIRNTQFNNNVSENGGAIHATGSDVRVVDSFFRGNRSTGNGGAIHATGGTLGLYGSEFGSSAGNLANDSGGAVFVTGTSSDEGVLVSSSAFYGNGAVTGGAIFAGINTSVFVSTGPFQGNGFLTEGDTFFPIGGAIYSEGNGIYVSDASFLQNQATQGAAIYSAATYSNFRGLDVSANVSRAFSSGIEPASVGGGLLFIGEEAYVSDSTVSRNEAEGIAGGIAVSGSKLVLRRVTIEGNSAGNSGGGVAASPETTLRIFGSMVTGNVAGELGGGGISVAGSDFLMTGSTVTENRVTGGFAAGGGIAVTGGSTLVFNSTISNNESESNAGGLLVRDDGYARLQNTEVNSNTSKATGGAIDVRSSTLVLVGGEVSFNEATEFVFGSRAGAVNVEDDSRMFVRSGTRFESNTAQALGGAIQVAGLLSVQDAEFVSNSAASGGAIFLTANGRIYVQRTQFLRNRVQTNGGAIFARAELLRNPILILTASTFTENEVTDNENGHPVDIRGTVFWRDTLGASFDNTPNDGIGVT